MYEDYWKVKEKPFENNFDLRFLYLSLPYEEVLTRLQFVVRERRKGAIVSGYYGSGKSLILHQFMKKVEEMEGPYKTIYINDPLMSITEFHRELLHQIVPDANGQTAGGDASESRRSLVATLKELLIGVHEKGGHTVLVVDEATLVPAETLEELRLLVDLCHPESQKTLLSLILAGPFDESDLPSHLKHPALRQRLPLKCTVGNLDEEECGEYIKHRLTVAGQPNQLFTDDAIKKITECTGGSPRSINNICDLALFLGYSQSAVKVDADIVDLVTEEIGETLDSSKAANS